MLELQKIFLLVKFFNQISCNKSSKATISCFFLCFFCLTPLRLECSRSRKTTSFLTTSYMRVSCKLPYCMSGMASPPPFLWKTTSFLTSHGLKKYKNLDPQSFTNRVKIWSMLKIAHFWRKIANWCKTTRNNRTGSCILACGNFL